LVTSFKDSFQIQVQGRRGVTGDKIKPITLCPLDPASSCPPNMQDTLNPPNTQKSSLFQHQLKVPNVVYPVSSDSSVRETWSMVHAEEKSSPALSLPQLSNLLKKYHDGKTIA
jgi:hypothetical protein